MSKTIEFPTSTQVRWTRELMASGEVKGNPNQVEDVLRALELPVSKTQVEALSCMPAMAEPVWS